MNSKNEFNVKPIYSNFKRNNKWLGIIDYKSLVVLISYIFGIGYLISLIPLKIEFLIYIFLFFTIPVASLFFININNSSILDVLFTIAKFEKARVVYVRKYQIRNLKNEIYSKIK